jgi:transcriptional repressor NF-X1
VNRCSRLQEDPSFPLSCGRACGKPLPCGNHFCKQPCHPDECSECLEIETIKCYCGKESKQAPCGNGEPKTCSTLVDGELNEWKGRYECESLCGQPYICGIHRCDGVSTFSPLCFLSLLTEMPIQNCHPPSRFFDICPRDPSIVTTCPCGKHLVGSLPNGVRTSCVDPIPTCGSTCGKIHGSCFHACLSECHTGPCPPCTVQINVACRCGQTARYIPCSVRQTQLQDAETGESDGQILCDVKCGGMRHCGRHACSRVCCPLAGVSQIAKKAGRAKRRGAIDPQVLEDEDVEGWHVCDLVRYDFLPGVCDLILSYRHVISASHAAIMFARNQIIVAHVHPAFNRHSKRFGLCDNSNILVEN